MIDVIIFERPQSQIAFTRSILKHVSANLCADSNRFYASGKSNVSYLSCTSIFLLLTNNYEQGGGFVSGDPIHFVSRMLIDSRR